MFEKIFVILLFIKETISIGSITPSPKNAVTQTLSNKDQYSDYTFNFLLDNMLEIGGVLEITFPKEYSNQFEKTTCEEKIQIIANKIQIQYKIDLFPQKLYSIKFKQIKNPPSSIGTGNFYLKTKKGGNLIDESLIFPATGIWKEITNLTSTTVALDADYSYAGENTKYIFSFKTPEALPSNISVLIMLPANTFIVSEFPSCSSFAINGIKIKANLVCRYADNKIEITGFLEDMRKGSILGILIRLGNPRYSLVTDFFNIFIFKKDTNSAFFQKLNIKGVSISPGKITQISLQPYDSLMSISKGKRIYLRLKFKLQNGLPENSRIEIKLPNGFNLYKIDNFTLDRAWSYFIESGLEDKSTDEILKMVNSVVDGFDVLTISSFKSQKTPGIISIVFLVDIPNIIGKTSSLEIKSLLENNSEIDKNITDSFLIIDDISIPTIYDFQISSCNADDSTIVDVTINFNCNKELGENSMLRVLVDNNLILNQINDPDCFIWNDVNSAFENIGKCYTDDRFLILEIRQNIELGIKKIIKIANAFRSPQFSGYYYFEISNLIGSKIIQSFGKIVYFVPEVLLNLSSKVFPVYLNQKSVIDVNFVTPYDLEFSPLENSNSILSFIQLEFVGLAIIQKDLGMNVSLNQKKEIACKSLVGLLPAFGNSIKCFLKAEATPKIIITNYQRVSKNQYLSLLIPNFLNPNGTWDLVIKCVYLKNRLYTILAQSKFTVTTNVTLPNGLDTTLNNDGSVFYNISNKKLNDFFEISFLITDSTIIDKDSKIIVELPTFDVGFLVQESYIVCNIMGIYFECHHFPGVDWIYIMIDRSLSPIANKTIINIKNLKWPRYRIENFPATKNTFRFIDKNAQITKIMYYPYFARSDTGSLEYIDIRIDKREKSNIDVQYLFKIKSLNDIPENSQIQITFPDVYNLWAPFPAIQIESPEIEKLSNNTQNYTFSENTILISNTPFLSKNIYFRVTVSGVRNPDTSAALGSWAISIAKDGNKIAEKLNFMSFFLMSDFQAKRVQIHEISCFPTNQNLIATYYFSFSFQTKLNVKSQIFIEFPPEFTSLPNYFDCFISGSLNTFYSCTRKASKFVIELDTQYISGEIKISIDNITNPEQEKTGIFNIYSKYDSKVVDESKVDSEPKRVIFFSQKASFFSLKEFNFNPITEAQIARYFFSAQPSDDIAPGENLVIKFPKLFDLKLGYNVSLQVLSGLKGEVKYKIEERKFIIYGFSPYQVEDGLITFIIKGIINPNKPKNGDAGFLSIGILNKNLVQFKEFLEKACIIDLERNPQPLEIGVFEFSNLYSRLKANLTATMYLEDNFDYTTNLIYLDLPDEFEESDGKVFLNCKLNEITSECFQESRRVTIKALNNDLQGMLKMHIENILNPLNELTTGYFKFSIYNQLTKSILYQTYNNLNNLYLTYKYPGPLLIANNDQPVYIEKGSHSKFLNLTMTEICALNLKIIGLSNLIALNPIEIDFPIGQINKEFRLAVPMETEEEELFFHWQILGDFENPIYTPIKKTQVFITEKKNLPILVEEINDIPLLGTSLGIAIHTDFAPSTGIEIRLTFEEDYPNVKLNTTEVIFNSGQNTNFFEISCLTGSSTNLISGIVVLEIKGVNEDVYELEKTKLKFNIVNFDDRKPEILDLKLTNISQVSARIFVSVNEIVTVYYYNALRYTQAPFIEEVFNQSFDNLDTTQAQFGILHVSNDLSIEFPINNLSAETDYVIYVYLFDRGRNYVEVPAVLEYKTNNKYNAALVNIGFLQSYINQAEKLIIFDYLAFSMSLVKDKIEETKYDFDFIVQEKHLVEADDSKIKTQIETVLKFTIKADPLSGIYPSPLTLSKLLTNKKTRIKEQFNNFNLNFEINAQEFERYLPNFASIPTIKNFNHNSIILLTKLDNFGWVYAVIIKKNEDLGKPSSFQISKGCNNLNISKNYGFVEVSLKFELFELTIDGLDSDTYYNIYLTAGSAHPGFPDLINSNLVQELDFKTLTTPEVPKLSLEFEFRYLACFFIILTIL